MKIAFVIYRQWGYEIFKKIVAFQKIRGDFTVDTLIIPANSYLNIAQEKQEKFTIYSVDPLDSKRIDTILTNNAIDIVCFYSWSWIVKRPLLEKYICLCLHPSPLPKYRGGTPIQHQVLRNETNSAVTIFKMSEGIDNGDIYQQTPISFLGTIDNIFNRMVDVGTLITQQLIEDTINNELVFIPQKNLEKYPPYKRRVPSQSRIHINDVENMTYHTLSNLVRCLLDPYPNAFIEIGKKRISLLSLAKYKTLPSNVLILNDKPIPSLYNTKKAIFLRLKDGFAKICRYKITTIKQSVD